MKKRHTKSGYFANLGRKGGNATKRNHQPSKRYYSTVGKKGGLSLRKKVSGR